MMSTVYIGDFVSYYLALLNGTDPTPVKIISYLKDELAKPLEQFSAWLASRGDLDGSWLIYSTSPIAVHSSAGCRDVRDVPRGSIRPPTARGSIWRECKPQRLNQQMNRQYLSLDKPIYEQYWLWLQQRASRQSGPTHGEQLAMRDLFWSRRDRTRCCS